MPQITQIFRKTTTTGRLSFTRTGTQNYSGPGTVLAYIKSTLVNTSLKYYFSPTSAGSGIRLFEGYSSASTESYIGLGSSGASLNPSLRVTGGSVANVWRHHLSQWDGTLNATGIIANHADDGAGWNNPATTIDGAAGVGSLVLSDTSGLHIGNRGDGARGWQGDIAYIAWWNRVLSQAEVDQARANGPLSVPTGLIFLYANGADLSTNASGQSFTSGVTTITDAGQFPLNLNLGGDAVNADASGSIPTVTVSAPTGVASGSSVVNANASGSIPTVTVSAPTGTASASGATTAIISNASGCNPNATASTVTNATSNTPTVDILPRTPEIGVWQQYLFGLSGVAGKSVTVNVDHTNDQVVGILGTYDGPWWTTTPNDVTSWVKVASYSYNSGTKIKNYTLNAHGAADTIYVASTPAMTYQSVQTWIQSVQAAFPTLFHDDLLTRRYSSDPFTIGMTIPAPDENGRMSPALPYFGFRISNDAAGEQPPNAKRRVIINCGTHAGEYFGFHQMRGFINEWCTGTNSAFLLENFDLYVYPLINPNGNYLGYHRHAPEPISGNNDMNRKFTANLNDSTDCNHWMALWAEEHGANLDHVVFAIDFHDAFSTDPTAHYFIKSDTPNKTAINAIITAQYAGMTAVDGTTAGTTYEYFQNRGVLNVTAEAADERAMSVYDAIGRAYVNAIKALSDAGHLPVRKTTRFGAQTAFQFDASDNGFVDGGGSHQWARITGPVPSVSTTGPDRAHAGTHYFYTESAGTSNGSTFRLQKACDFTQVKSITFRYNRRLNVGSTFTVEVWNGTAWVTKLTTAASFGNKYFWRHAFIDCSELNNADGLVRFTQSITSGTDNDMGLDSVVFWGEETQNATASGSIPTVTVSAPTGVASGSTVINTNASGSIPTVAVSAPTGVASGATVINANASGSIPSVTVSAPTGVASGTTVINANAAGSIPTVTVTAPVGAASAGSVVNANAAGSIPALTLVAPTGVASGSSVVNANASGSIPPLTLVAPTGAASAGSVINANASGSIPALTLVVPTGVASGTAVINANASGSIPSLTLVAPTGVADGQSPDANASGSIPVLTLVAPTGVASGTVVINAEASGSIPQLTVIAPDGAVIQYVGAPRGTRPFTRELGELSRPTQKEIKRA